MKTQRFKDSKLQRNNKDLQLTIGWLYPELMSTYGDRGNVICLTKRCQWRGVEVKVERIEFETKDEILKSCDLILGGGAQDRQQTLVINDLKKNKGKAMKEMFERGVPGLFVCGSPQLLGHYYMTGDGEKLDGLGIFDFVTKHFGHDKPRCIGNTVGLLNLELETKNQGQRKTIVGFENHGGRTYLGKVQPFAKVMKGNGNNGEDGTEGAIFNNVIACYFHGPLLPKNPHVADWLITKSLQVKYKTEIRLTELDDTLEWQAHNFLLKRAGVI